MYKPPIWLRLDIFFFVLTLAYWIGSFAGFGMNICSGGSSCSSDGSPILNLIGLFVPVGPNNSLLFMLFLGTILAQVIKLLTPLYIGVYLLPTLAMFGIVHIIERGLQRIPIPLFTRPIVNLSILGVLTLLLDLLMFQNWASMLILFNSLT